MNKEKLSTTGSFFVFRKLDADGSQNTSSRYLAAVGLLPFESSFMADTIHKRTIPSSGEQLPVVGLGTWQTFDVDNSDREQDPLKEVLKNLISKGAKVGSVWETAG